jgi:1,3,6,8-tetrahydroxynaphthalene synthase
MPVLCSPALLFPDYEITVKDTLESAREIHADHPRLGTILSLIEHTGVRTRRILQPLELTLQHPGVAARAELYWEAVCRYLPKLVQTALDYADVSKDQIDAVLFVSCTGFSMPSPIVWMINELGFPTQVRQLPIAQLGCTAGSSAIDLAAQYCRANPRHNALIVAFELCSLCYQPTDTDVGSVLSAGLFGDGFAAAVMKGDGNVGQRNGSASLTVGRSAAELIPRTSEWISFDIKETGVHFRLDSRVRTTMRAVAPSMANLVKEAGWNIKELDFVVAHAGGPRILDDLTTYLDIDPSHHQFSRAALAEHGNTASVLIFDVLARLYASDIATSGSRGILAGFGPGVSAAFSLGTFR